MAEGQLLRKLIRAGSRTDSEEFRTAAQELIRLESPKDAATNHERLLDRAIWRRFDEVLFFDKPNLEQIRQLLPIKLRGVRYELPLRDTGFLNQLTGLTHASIERALIRAIKAMALKGRQLLTLDLLTEALSREERRNTLLSKL